MAKKLTLDELIPAIGEEAARTVIALQSPGKADKAKWYMVKLTDAQVAEFQEANPELEIKPRYTKKAE